MTVLDSTGLGHGSLVGICEDGNKYLGSLDAGDFVEKLHLFTFSGLHSTTAGNVIVKTKNDGRRAMCKWLAYLGYIIALLVCYWVRS
jgi:hypothetical protein